jgi:rhomboid protease GluP
MNPNQLLLWVSGASSLVMLLSAARARARARGWIVVSLAVLAVTAAGALLFPELAGFVAGGLWALFVLIPSAGYRWVARLTVRQRYGAARRLAEVLRFLHPYDGWLEQPRLLRALEHAQGGRFTEAFALLESPRLASTAVGRTATAITYRLSGRWEELLDWVSQLPEAAIVEDVTLMSVTLRALGEVGDLPRLVQMFERLQRPLSGMAMASVRNQCRLILFAFTGRREATDRLLDGPLSQYPAEAKELWRATADAAAGREAVAHARLNELLPRADPVTRIATARRLSHPLADARTLSGDLQARIARAEEELGDELRYGRVGAAGGSRPYATLFLIGINLGVFALEMARGGSEDLTTLYNLGALDPEAVLRGEWWRLFTSIFLHFGGLHLAVNMLGLLLLGSSVERAAGLWRYLVVYFVSGVGSMLFVVLISEAKGALALVVGASGSIMGLIGADAALLWEGWRQRRAAIARRRLLELVSILLLQVAFDLSTPEVSFVGHASGALMGFVIMWLVRRRGP